MLPADEKKTLRELAKALAGITEDPSWDEKRRLWKAKNSLKKVRPLVLAALPEAAWQELIPESKLQVQTPVFRDFERYMRRLLYRGQHIHDDYVLSNKLYIPIRYQVTDWFEGRSRPYSSDPFKAAAYEPCIHTPDDVLKLKKPQIVDIEWKETHRLYEEALEVFEGTMDVCPGEPFYAGTDKKVTGSGNGLVDLLCELRGLENIFYDIVDEEDMVHEIMRILMEGTNEYLDQMETYGLLRLNNNEYMPGADSPLNSNGLAVTDELPGEPFDREHIKTQNLWGYVQAQEFTGVSPDMLEEFIHPYQRQIAERFGMVCYGCCEKEDKKWDAVMKNIPNLRELSVAYSCDLEIAADKIQDQYVFSWKPHSTMVTHFDADTVRSDLQKGLDITKNCHLVISMRDTQTLNNRPESVAQWTDIAMELSGHYSPENL